MRRLFLALLWVCSTTTPCVAAEVVPPTVRVYARSVVRNAHLYWGLSSPLEVFFGQIHQESRWEANAQSIYAAGLTQFTPETAADIQRLLPADMQVACAKRDCRFDPEWAIRALTVYDKQLYEHYHYDTADSYPDERFAFMLASYNGGAGWIDRERMACMQSDCEPDIYFGEVELMCGRTMPRRSAAACHENSGYSHLILHRWAPMYKTWLDTNMIR